MRVREFFKLSLLVVLAAVLIVVISAAGLLAFILVTARWEQSWNAPVSEISEALTTDEDVPGGYRFSMQQLLVQPDRCGLL